MSGHGGWDFDAIFLELGVSREYLFFIFLELNFCETKIWLLSHQREDLLT